MSFQDGQTKTEDVCFSVCIQNPSSVLCSVMKQMIDNLQCYILLTFRAGFFKVVYLKNLY